MYSIDIAITIEIFNYLHLYNY